MQLFLDRITSIAELQIVSIVLQTCAALHCRFIHIPSKVNPKTAVEEHRERIAAAKIVHAREAQPVARPPKGVQYEDPNQEALKEEQEEQGVGRMNHDSEDECQSEAAQGGSGRWQQGGSADLQAGRLGQLVEGLSSAEAKEVQASLAAIAQEETNLAGNRQRGISLPAVKLELPEEAVGQQPLGQEPVGQAPPEQDAMVQEHVGQEDMGQQPLGNEPVGRAPPKQEAMVPGQQTGGVGQAEEAFEEEDLYRDLYGVKMERVDQDAGQDADVLASKGSSSSDGQDWEQEALQDSLFQGGQSSDESESGGGARVDAMETD